MDYLIPINKVYKKVKTDKLLIITNKQVSPHLDNQVGKSIFNFYTSILIRVFA